MISEILKNLSNIAEIDCTIVPNLARQLSKIIEEYPQAITQINDSISKGQIESKQWLVEKIQHLNLGNIFLCGGWFAILLLDKKLKYQRCINFDIDQQSILISILLHKQLVIDNWKFQAVLQNIHDIDYSGHYFTINRHDGTECEMFLIPDTIINTSCEHIDNFEKWYKKIPNGKLVVLQTNDGFGINDHINCVNSLTEFEKQTPLNTVLYSGQLKLLKFTRYMRIGYK